MIPGVVLSIFFSLLDSYNNAHAIKNSINCTPKSKKQQKKKVENFHDTPFFLAGQPFLDSLLWIIFILFLFIRLYHNATAVFPSQKPLR